MAKQEESRIQFLPKEMFWGLETRALIFFVVLTFIFHFIKRFHINHFFFANR